VPAALWTLGATILVALVDGALVDGALVGGALVGGAGGPWAPLSAVAALLTLAVLARVMLPAGPDTRSALPLAATSHARSRGQRQSRVTDPDAAGRPRPRAPSASTA
jgi:hypothetical protein